VAFTNQNAITDTESRRTFLNIIILVRLLTVSNASVRASGASLDGFGANLRHAF